MPSWGNDTGLYVGGCQNYDPVLGPLNTRCRIIPRTQKGTIILITTHVVVSKKVDHGSCREPITDLQPPQDDRCGMLIPRPQYPRPALHEAGVHDLNRVYYEPRVASGTSRSLGLLRESSGRWRTAATWACFALWEFPKTQGPRYRPQPSTHLAVRSWLSMQSEVGGC